jgi:hypothetical protein
VIASTKQSAVACVSDAEAMRCANALPSASCSGVPAGCDVPDIADRGVAMAGCEQLLTTICNFQTRCRGMDPAECLPEVRMLLDCSAALGLKPIYGSRMAPLSTTVSLGRQVRKSAGSSYCFSFAFVAPGAAEAVGDHPTGLDRAPRGHTPCEARSPDCERNPPEGRAASRLKRGVQSPG